MRPPPPTPSFAPPGHFRGGACHRRSRISGFTLIEVLVAAGVLTVCVGAYLAATLSLHRLSFDADPRSAAQDVHIEVLKACLQADAASSDAVFACAGLLRLNGGDYRTATWAVSGVPAVAVDTTSMVATLTAGYAAAGQTLTTAALPATQSASTVLCLRADGRVRAVWEILNTETSVSRIAGLRTSIVRYVDTGAASLTKLGSYEQFLPGAVLTRPGGPASGGASATRPLASASALAGGGVRVHFPSAQVAYAELAITGGTKPESVTATTSIVDVQAESRPRL